MSGRVARVAADARVAWAVALVLAAALGVLALLYVPLLLAERDRADVRAVAGAMAARLATFDSTDLEAWSAGVRALATDEYADEVGRLLDPAVRDDLSGAGVTSRGEVTDLHVEHLERTAARAFAVVRQRIQGAGGETSEATVRMTISLQRRGGGWLVNGVSVLPGPAGRTVPGGG